MYFTLYSREVNVLTWYKPTLLFGHSLINKKVEPSKSSLSPPVLDEPQALEFHQQSSYVAKIVLIDYVFFKGRGLMAVSH